MSHVARSRNFVADGVARLAAKLPPERQFFDLFSFFLLPVYMQPSVLLLKDPCYNTLLLSLSIKKKRSNSKDFSLDMRSKRIFLSIYYLFLFYNIISFKVHSSSQTRRKITLFSVFESEIFFQGEMILQILFTTRFKVQFYLFNDILIIFMSFIYNFDKFLS